MPVGYTIAVFTSAWQVIPAALFLTASTVTADTPRLPSARVAGVEVGGLNARFDRVSRHRRVEADHLHDVPFPPKQPHEHRVEAVG